MNFPTQLSKEAHSLQLYLGRSMQKKLNVKADVMSSTATSMMCNKSAS